MVLVYDRPYRMCDEATIEAPFIDADTPVAEEVSIDSAPLDGFEETFALDAIDEQTEVLAAFPTMSKSSREVARSRVQARPAIIALAIALVVHIGVAVAGYWVIHRLHVFVAARPQVVEGDGASALGAIDHDGNDQAPGAIGPGSLTPGWSAPLGPDAAAAHLGDTPALDANDVPPPPAGAAPPPDPSDANSSDVGPTPPLVAADVAVDPLQPDMLPVFTRPPREPSQPSSPTTMPVDRPAPATQPASPRPPIGVASKQTAPHAAAFSPVAAADQGIADTARAMAAGFSSPASDNPGGLLHREGTGGSNGKGGATSGDGGRAVSGRPGSPAGVKGRPLHADYPDYCRSRGETGRVDVEVNIRADGTVASVRVLSDAGHPRLAQAAVDAFQGRTFYPALLDGRPVRSTQRYPFVFELH